MESHCGLLHLASFTQHNANATLRVYHSSFIHPSAEGHSGCCWFGAMMSGAATKIRIQVFAGPVFISLGSMPRNAMAGPDAKCV